jgi:predicted SprT family Zn-dependent metalloprotease
VKNELTSEEYDSLAQAYGWFNEKLFQNELPDCLITLERSRSAYGYFWHQKFIKRHGTKYSHQIALNPDAFPHRKDRHILSTLVHEMVHLWQAEFGMPGRGRYHNEEWAAKMKEVGLIPTATGRCGGKQTGDRMTHLIARKQPFAQAFGELYRTGFRLRWQSLPARTRPDESKRKFTCPGCGINVWGAASLDGQIGCMKCDKALQLQKHRRQAH